MSNILIINGSPRKKGNTSFLSKTLVDTLLYKNYSSEVIRISELKINPCIDCRACKKGSLICVIKDDMQYIYDKMEAAGTIIFATPIYWFGPTAQMKNAIDRLRPFYGNKKLTGKKTAIILAAGSGPDDCDLTLEMFRRISLTLGLNFKGNVMAGVYDAGDAKTQPQLINEISHLVENILS